MKTLHIWRDNFFQSLGGVICVFQRFSQKEICQEGKAIKGN
jgi:hypothetical protein